MSSTQSTSVLPASAGRSSPWIINWKQDLLWFVGPPLFLVPLFTLLLHRIPLQQLSLLVVTFGAVGHHLPGMLRAYGDAELFARYRIRFNVAPVFLVTVCILYSFYRPDTLSVVVLVWGFWHSQAQIYGFLRIYDSKAGLTDQRTASVDRLLCLSWFAGGIVMSEGRMADFLSVYYRSGGFPISADFIRLLQTAFQGLMLLSVLAYLGHMAWNRSRGRRPSMVKLLAVVLSIGFWWYCMVGIRNIVLGIALYEVFHDVQYLAIVWFFNRRRASSGSSTGWLTQHLFRPQTRFVFLYVCLVLAYGASSLLTRTISQTAMQTMLTGLFAASGLLHFYYDGFIWRIRDRSTSQTLGVQNANSPQAALAGNAGRLKHVAGLKHVAMWLLFVIPLLLLSFTSRTQDIYGMVVDSMPDNADAHSGLASQLLRQGDLDAAEKHAVTASKLHPLSGRTWALQGEIRLARNQPLQALTFLRKAIELEPLNALAHFNLGNALVQTNQVPAAVEQYEEAIRIDPKLESNCYNNLGAALLDVGAPHDAEPAFRRAIESDGGNLDAIRNLAQTLTRLARPEEAKQLYRQALDLQDDSPTTWSALAKLLIFTGELQQAEETISQYQKRFPDEADAFSTLGLLRTRQHQFSAAEQAFKQALDIDPHHFQAHFGLAESRLEQGDAEGCLQLIESIRSSQPVTAAERQNLDALQNRARR
jgi:tetratricopeptide (TPR) repeat protein